MEACIIFGWRLSGQDMAAWLRKNDWRLDADGLVPRSSEQRAERSRLFPPGVWLTYAAPTKDADISARLYAVTLLAPGRGQATLADVLDVPLDLVDVARATVEHIRPLPRLGDPELHALPLPEPWQVLENEARSVSEQMITDLSEIMEPSPKPFLKTDGRSLACERYTKFLLQSYLKWHSSDDLRDCACLVRFHQPTLIDGRAYYPSEFLDLLKLQLLLDLEVQYHASATGWSPNVEVSMMPDNTALSLNIWFERLPRA